MRPAHHQTPRISIKTPPAPAGQRIGLMGGSFNPPHEAHVMVAQTALRRLRLDQVWWLVSPGNPLKTKQGLPTLSQRLAACRAITSHDKRIHITGLESEIGSVYTADTVAFLTTRYSAVRFVWVMGADNLAEFHRWKRWREIAATLPIAIIDRPGWHLAGLSSPAARAFAKNRLPESRATALPFSKPPAWIFLSTRLSPQSSTALRGKNYKNQ